jgi:hypothetical protein
VNDGKRELSAAEQDRLLKGWMRSMENMPSFEERKAQIRAEREADERELEQLGEGLDPAQVLADSAALSTALDAMMDAVRVVAKNKPNADVDKLLAEAEVRQAEAAAARAKLIAEQQRQAEAGQFDLNRVIAGIEALPSFQVFAAREEAARKAKGL